MTKKTKAKPVVKSSARRLDAMVVAYLDWLEVHHFSPNTIKKRRHTLRRFVEWCAARSIEQANEVTPAVIERYQKWISGYRKKNGKPLSRKSQSSLFEAVPAMFQWAFKRKRMLTNPAAHIAHIRYPRRLPAQVMSPQEVETFLASIETDTELGIRDRAIFETLYTTGARRAELAAVELEHLDMERGILRVLGKGDKERVVPVGPRALRWLDRYLLEVRLYWAHPDERALFVTNRGTAIRLSALSNMVARRFRKHGLPGGCHVFRHSAATAMLDAGADIRFIQELLGHNHLSSTQVYTSVSMQKLKEVHDRTHPAKLKRSRKDDQEAQ